MEYTQLIVTLLAFVLCMVKSDTRPNIIFIFTDDWGWNDVSYNGGTYLQTDFIDSLAKDGLILSQHYVLPTCTPSRAALLTGRYPANLGLQHSTISPGAIYGVPLESKFIGDELQSYGYSTHMIGKWHLGFCAWEYTPLYRGFDTFSGFFLGAEGYTTHNRTVIHNGASIDGYDLRRGMDIVEDAQGTYSTYWHYSELSNLMTDLQSTKDENPFFIYLAWQNSHNPPEAPKSYLKTYKDIASGARWFFMGQTAVLDDVMEDFIDELKSKDLWDNTLIVFASDNGAQKDSGDNAPLRGAKSTLWEGAIRVPAFVTGGYLPDNLRGTTTNEMIHVTDWYSTFTSLAKPESETTEESEIDSETETDGYDISSVILEGEPAEREEFLINVNRVNCQSEMCGALRYKNYKIIMGGHGITTSQSDKSDCFWIRDYMSDELNADGLLTLSQCGVVPDDVDTDVCGCSEKACLFDLDADPCEYYDLADNSDYEDIYNEMYEKLKDYYDSQVHPWKDIFDDDYNNADPRLHNNFWTPWLEKEELISKQAKQMTAFNGETEDSDSLLKIFYRVSETASDVFNDTPLWIGISFGLFALIILYLSYRCNWCCCKVLCCCKCGSSDSKKGKGICGRKSSKNSDGRERNPLLGGKSSRYS